MSRLVIKNHDGEEISLAFALVLVAIVSPCNLLVLTYWSMLLAGALHSGAPRFPALGIWSAACAVVLFRAFCWKNGPIMLNAPKR